MERTGECFKKLFYKEERIRQANAILEAGMDNA